MEIGKQLKLFIIILLLAIILLIVIFNIEAIYVNKENRRMLIKTANTMRENIELIESNRMILPPFLMGIIEYDESDFNNHRVLFKNLEFKVKKMNTYRHVFIYDHPILEKTKIAFVFEEFNHYYEIFTILTSSIVVILLIVILLILIYLYFKRKEHIKMISSFIEHEDIELLKETLKNDDELELLIEVFRSYEIKIAKTIKKCEVNEIKIIEENTILKNKDIFRTGIIENVSHELMTPLTKIKGYLDYIYSEKMGKLNNTQKSGLLVAKKNVNILLKQVDQILNYIKDESFVLTKSLFSLNKLIKDIIDTYTDDAKERGIKLDIDIDNIKAPVRGNRNALYDVYNNVINNALKFTQKDGIVKIIGYEKLIDKTYFSIVKIIDTGIGIPSDKLKTIFEKFYQIEHNENRKYQGMGLGLTIVKNIIKEHNGFIDINSIVSRGSTITIGIPILSKEGNNGKE